MNTLTGIFRDNRFTPETLPTFSNKLFYEGARRQPYIVRFVVLILLSTIIATYGVINDSAATVIGAMLIAPLMTPIMATAAALVMGQMARAIRSLALVGGGVFMAIALSYLIGAINIGVLSFTLNAQITGRISPRPTDLVIALASGAAGAFAMAREDVADSLPGVAISISLVPPLGVVGLALANGELAAAWGAALLFLTNFFSILLAGGGVLAFLGLGGVATRTLKGHARRNAFIAVALGVLLVTVPLAATGFRVALESLVEFRTASAAREWLQGSQYIVEGVDADLLEVELTISGEGELPQSEDLVAALQGQFSQPLIIDLKVVPVDVERLSVPTASDPPD